MPRDELRFQNMDHKVRTSLRHWPQCPPGAEPNSKQAGVWLRGRPSDESASCHPFLKLPGTDRYRTMPDGLWLHFGNDPLDRWCDILCIEACSTIANLLDKRARFAPSTTSLLAYCPVGWLLAAVQPDGPPRYKLIGMLRGRYPDEPLLVPIRDLRVLYGLRRAQYDGFAATQMPQPHEYFCPMEALADEASHENPAMRSLIARASAAANFMLLP
jgi:hypothetical protein